MSKKKVTESLTQLCLKKYDNTAKTKYSEYNALNLKIF